MEMIEFLKTFDNLAPDARGEAMLDTIGKHVRFRGGSNAPGRGLIHDKLFVVIGVQKAHDGEHCFRVRCTECADSFGRVMRVSEADFEV